MFNFTVKFCSTLKLILVPPLTSVEKDLKKLGLSQRTPKSSFNDVLTFVIKELEPSSRCLGYRAMHQKLLMNGFIIDHESVRLILKEQSIV